jgi:hypothetical protein
VTATGPWLSVSAPGAPGGIRGRERGGRHRRTQQGSSPGDAGQGSSFLPLGFPWGKEGCLSHHPHTSEEALHWTTCLSHHTSKLAPFHSPEACSVPKVPSYKFSGSTSVLCLKYKKPFPTRQHLHSLFPLSAVFSPEGCSWVAPPYPLGLCPLSSL